MARATFHGITISDAVFKALEKRRKTEMRRSVTETAVAIIAKELGISEDRI